jgi:hypothetical protein
MFRLSTTLRLGRLIGSPSGGADRTRALLRFLLLKCTLRVELHTILYMQLAPVHCIRDWLGLV